MARTLEQDPRTLVICSGESTLAGAEILNPNNWSGLSKGIVQSCWTKYSMLNYCTGRLRAICDEPESLCRNHVETIRQQWRTSSFDVGRFWILAEAPELHVLVEAFFSGIKSILDLLVQLLSSEKVVVGVIINGFHQSHDEYGGVVLNALANNASSSSKQIAARLHDLIAEQKALWIDQAIQVRNQLTHPEKWMHPLMLHLEFIEQGDNLICSKVTTPAIESESIDQYAQQKLKQLHEFVSKFLALLQDPKNV